MSVSSRRQPSGGLQQFLAQQRRKSRKICRDEIGEPNRVVNIERRGLQIVGKLRRTRHDVAEKLASVALHGHQFGVMRPNDVRLDLNLGREKWPEAQNFNHSNPLQTLQEHHDVSIGHFHQFMNLRGGPNGVQISSCELLDSRIVLSHDS